MAKHVHTETIHFGKTYTMIYVDNTLWNVAWCAYVFFNKPSLLVKLVHLCFI